MINIIMPAYNAERYIAYAIESILNQTYTDFEFFIIDDASTDNTYNIMRYYQNIDKRIKISSHHKNQGVASTLNELLSYCSSNYIARMDSDDWSHPTRLKKQVDFLDQNNNIDVVGAVMQICDENLIPLTRKGLNNLNETIHWCTAISHNSIETDLLDPKKAGDFIVGHPVVTYKKKAIDGYNENYKYAEDLDLYLRLMEEGFKLANIPECLLKYRLHNESICHRHFYEMWNSAQQAVYESRKRRMLSPLPIEAPNYRNLLFELNQSN
jgi:glycosyltransferase involved in cell wall biosynthesis